MAENKLMIIDGNSILNRAYYGLKGQYMLKTSEGLYTNAVYGFLNIMFKFLDEEKPQYICVAFDLKAPTFRHLEYDGYKAKRKGMDPELVAQVPLIKEVLDAMNIKRLEIEGYEADDIIGSVSLCAEEDGKDVIIVTGDRDSLQLATSTTRIKLPITKAGKTETEEYDFDKMTEKYGVTPTQFIDVKGLMGDTSDNIPGVPGIGEKTAFELIKKFESIENLYENLDQVDKKGVREKLEANRELAYLSKRLATIERKMPKQCGLEELIIKEFNKDKLYDIFKRLEFKSLIDKFKLTQYLEPQPTLEKAIQVEYIDDLSKIKALKNHIISFKEFSFYYFIDKVETFTTRLIGMGISYCKDKAVYIEIKDSSFEENFLNEFREVFEDASIKKFGHDVKTFIVYLKTRNIKFKGLSFDTMIGAYLINPSSDTYSISELAEEYLHKSIQPIESITGKGKSYIPFADISLEKISATAVTYSDAIFNVWKILDEKINENTQNELYYDVELPLVVVLADMEYWGFKVNIEDLKKFLIELEDKIGVIELQIYKLAGEKFNINSPKQLGVILFEKLELPAFKKTKTGYSTDAEVLEQLSGKHEIVSSILEFRQLIKLKSTYAEGLLNVINPNTGKIHSSFNQTVTVTGRISSTEPNLQNIPIKLEMGRKIRKVFIPSNSDYILLDADYSQIELRVLAHITNDENMISAFENNEDIHISTASKVFGVPKEEVTSTMRSRAKAVNFGIVYGIGDFSLSKDIGVSRKEARKYIDEYLNNYPNVKQYMQDIVVMGKQDGFVATMFKRRRYLPELTASNFNIRSFGERIAMNAPIQGSAADIIKIAMVKVYNELQGKNLKSRLVLQVHDELIIETFKDEQIEVAEILKSSMENAAYLKAPLSVEVKSGENWYETK